ncbi:dicarboxylate/amino acid:cation symporter [Porticoccus sp.]|uniref:dicarboxylate/amino acid:cation symporter n=1 Tax=Porticoccus sp. TaxID=2024853 RepID=UPI000C5268A8|nr:dicarboxylate/amino acid:cation symporter [Porticoccus sp.]MAZ69231.1 dicarboxylate/amino acid:cation symporter [Porticoccus sp.]|tara:strand:+ start:11652 stop:13097 length:1446 start_codon:yes stop_codon:yes gene_type:complete
MPNHNLLSSTVKALQPRSLKYLSASLQGLIRGKLWLQVLVGMFLGIVVGILMGPSLGWVSPADAAAISDWLALPGKLFLALIQMIVIPLVFASIIRGLAATEDLDQLKKTGFRVVLYFIFTTAIAIVIGITIANLIKPGQYVDQQALQLASLIETIPTAEASGNPVLDELPQKIVTLLPSNPLSAMVESNMLEVVIFAMIMGVALVMMTPLQAKPLLDLMGSLQEVCMTVVRWAMLLAPIAVFGLILQLTAKLGIDALLGMAVYVITVLLGLLVLLGLYLLIILIVARRHPLTFLNDIKEVLLLAFSTSSSAAVMPLSIKVAEEKLGVRPSISQFVIPLGATINMNGTALYQGVAAMFIAQVFGIDIGLGGMVLIVITAVGASIGSPATPGVGIVILAMVLDSVGIPAAGIALIMGVDRILDMCRTAINVSGDLVTAKLMDQWVGSNLSHHAERLKEQQQEIVREQTGEDVLTNTNNLREG